METINSFRGENYFLSNFYPAKVVYEGITYDNNEAAFQAQKTMDEEMRKEFMNLSPSEAKRKGRRVSLRPDWEDVKEEVMRKIVLAKFTQNPSLKEKLIATGDAYLEEGNDWGDRTWGTVNGQGRNLLGKILMGTRQLLMQTSESQEDNENTLIILERSNGWYGGYLYRNGRYEQVFNTDARCLFVDIKHYTDMGYHIRCLDKAMEADFMKGRTTLQQILETENHITIWRYETAGPFQMGGPSRNAIATSVCIHDYETVELEKGFAGLVVKDGPAKGVYEMKSGGLVGDTVEDVNADIRACDDIEMMTKQIEEAGVICKSLKLVSNVRFGLERG